MDSSSSYPGSLDPMISLPFPATPSFPRFPTVQELADQHQAEQDRPRPRSPGAFEALLGDPRILHAAWLENPDAFDPRLGPVLQRLLTDQKIQDLDPQSLGLLDAATIEFAQYRPKKVPPPPTPARAQSDDQDDEEGPMEWRERGSGRGGDRVVEISDVTAMPTRWWERRG